MTGQQTAGAKSEIEYGHRRTIDLTYDQAVDHARNALQAEGFGVLCEIDIKEKLKEKLGVEFRKYVILGACNPPLAYKALQQEIDIGLLLPCNVIVYETDEPGKSVVAAIDANEMLSVAGSKTTTLNSVANEVNEKLKRVVLRL
jgi:uncharacterized protein (DUF302 family)